MNQIRAHPDTYLLVSVYVYQMLYIHLLAIILLMQTSASCFSVALLLSFAWGFRQCFSSVFHLSNIDKN